MKNFRIIGTNISDAFKSVFRNFSLSLASIFCITITLLLVSVAFLLSMNVNKFTEDIEKDVTIVVAIEKDATESDFVSLKNKINTLNNIDSIIFISNEQIRKEMQKEGEGLETILSQYDETTNPLLNEYFVKVLDVEKIGETAKQIKELDKVYTVKYGEGMVEDLVKTFDSIKKVMYIIVGGLLLVTAFLIGNTIKITINNRKRQIEIERLVGASNSYIKRPYFIEGIILGFLGSLIPILVTCFGYIYLYESMGGIFFTEVITLINPDKILLNLSLILMGVGVVVGALSSYRSVRRYLKI